MASFEQVSDPNVELLGDVEVVDREILRSENRDELGIRSKRGIGAQVRGDFLILILRIKVRVAFKEWLWVRARSIA